jgi:transcriptional regulator
MYIARVDGGISEDEWREFVASEGFGHLVAAGKGRDVPVVVPTQFVLDSDEVILHLVGKNPILEAIDEQPRVLMSVAGDWAFIPSSWKAVGEEDPLLGIPTTYYAAAQIQGSATIVSDVGEVAAILRRQLVALQPGLEVADPLAAHEAQLSTIRGIRIVIEEVRAKFKYGGNVDVGHREAVIAALERRGEPGDLAAARQTRRRMGAHGQ